MRDYFSGLNFDQKKELDHEIQVTGTLGECKLVILVLEIAKKGNAQHSLTGILYFGKANFKSFREEI